MYRRILSPLVAFGLCCGVLGAREVPLTILYTTDLHGHLLSVPTKKEPRGAGGLLFSLVHADFQGLRFAGIGIVRSVEGHEDGISAEGPRGFIRHERVHVVELFELARGEIGLLKIDALDLDLGVLIEEVATEMSPIAT